MLPVCEGLLVLQFSTIYLKKMFKNYDVICRNLYQGKLWWAGMAMVTTLSRGGKVSTKVSSCSLALPPTPAPSLICLNRGLATASPSCLGECLSSVEEGMVLSTSTPAYLGLQATAVGLPCTQ